MATVAHYIRSDYDPQRDEQRLRRETGQPDEEPEEDAWHTQQPFGTRAYAPRFVPATLSYDEWGNVLTAPTNADTPERPDEKAVAGWYRSLTSQASSASHSSPSASSPARDASSSLPPSEPPAASRYPSIRRERDWFITRALAHPLSAPPTPAPPTTLAGILSRDPPSAQPHQPPVFLHLGPSNKGWAMLQSKGWSEGEGLGSTVHRSADVERRVRDDAANSARRPRRRVKNEDAIETSPSVSVQHERVEVQLDDDIVEVKLTPVIDLTLSDTASEPESEQDDDENAVSFTAFEFPARSPDQKPADPRTRHAGQTALLTPISTVLKSDRLGIGLKAKTEGPYKSSVKRVTHNAAALAAHLKAAEDARRAKQLVGRGKRAFEKEARKERQERKDLLAYLNT
ncbi:hypothetical protein FA95DRAFT_1553368 [Auriscalpium vulgare]|uniref:Uncharacterized protein n=1 Tax=Auriscalpium vulgare TaxID=40419 RepID=A0ACB8S9W2_9AGAM|nr:hypothetical protein FA95DRAFT_1553368 [Auriscalpium vulgare]